MNAIVSVTSTWGIGHEGRLVVRNPADMRFFKEQTMGGTVICGRTTFQSFPGGALKGRRNIVLSTNPVYAPAGAEVVRTVEEALAAVAQDDPSKVWVIGGQSVYEQLLPYCDKALVTKNDVDVPADTYFPNLDADSSWQLVSSTPDQVPGAHTFSFNTYVRK